MEDNWIVFSSCAVQGRCCLDGYHCCPYGYDCDLTYTRCVRQILSYPFFNQPALSSVPASRISPPEDDAKPREVGFITDYETLYSRCIKSQAEHLDLFHKILHVITKKKIQSVK